MKGEGRCNNWFSRKEPLTAIVAFTAFGDQRAGCKTCTISSLKNSVHATVTKP